MKTLTVAAIQLLLIALVAFTVAHKELPIGAALPKADLKMKDISGKGVSLKEAAGTNGLLVMFSCNTCPVVAKNSSRTKEICRYALQNNIGIVLVNSNEATRNEGDSFEDMKQYAKQQSYAWYYVLDENNAVADAFEARRTPECFCSIKN